MQISHGFFQERSSSVINILDNFHLLACATVGRILILTAGLSFLVTSNKFPTFNQVGIATLELI